MEEKRDFKKAIQDFLEDNKSIPQFQVFLQDGFQIEEICDKGLMNFVFRVQSMDQSQSIIIKYGEEHMKVHAEGIEYKSLTRQEVEFDSLVLLSKVCPGCAPTPYCFDKKHHIIAMEDLKHLELLGSFLEAGTLEPELATRIGKLLATIHNRTHRLVNREAWEKLEAKFTQKKMKEVDKSVMFRNAFNEGSSQADIPEGGTEKYKKAVNQIKKMGALEKISNLHDSNECFIHADCHWNHLATFPGTDRVVVLDLEFAFLGNPCINMAYSLLGYPLFYFAMGEKPETERSTFRNDAKLAVKNTVDAYLEETEIFKDTGSKSDFVSNVALTYGAVQFFLSVFSGIGIFLPITGKQRIDLMESASHVMQEHEAIQTSVQISEALFWEPTND